jgi:glycosyltransferase involved in cell wall biosynthesis
MPELYRQADLVVQSSLTEGLPNVMLEAAYLGVPVVATDAGGTGEAIEHGVNGWLVPVGSVTALVTGLCRYLENPEDFIVMANAGRQRVEAKFSMDSRTTRQTLLYEELAEKTA